MSSVFGADASRPVVVRAGKAILTVDDQNLLALNVTIQFTRTVEVIPTIGAQRVLSVGEATGTLSAETVLAKNSDALAAFHLTADECQPIPIQIRFADGTCDVSGKTVTAQNCIGSALTITAQGGRGMVAQGVQVTFTALDM